MPENTHVPGRSIRSLVGRALDRYGLRPGRELVRRADAMGPAVDELQRRVAELEQEAANRQLHFPILNGASGELVLSRYRPLFGSAGDGGAVPIEVLEAVPTDVGCLVMPRFDRFILPSLRNTGGWEPDEADFLRAVVRPGMNALDVGANVGYSALLLSQLVGPTGMVVALEPEPFNFRLLCRNVTANRAANVLPIHSAAGDATGTITLQRSPDNTGDHRAGNHPLGIAPLHVPVVALDDLLPPEFRIDAVMIDAQGYDHRVVAGMRQVVLRHRPILLVEFWPTGILEVGDDPDEALEEYRRLGYGARLLPDRDVSSLSAAEIFEIVEGDHVSMALIPG